MAYDNYKYPGFSYGEKKKPQPSKPREKKAIEPLVKKVVEPLIATRDCYVGDKELVTGEPVTGLPENVIKSLKKRGLVK